MIEQVKTEITEEDNAGTVHDRLMVLGAQCVIHTVESLINGELTTSPQPSGEFIGAPKIFKEDCKIDWNKPARSIFNHIRGLAPYPAAWSIIKDNMGKLFDVKILESKETVVPAGEDLSPGECRVEKKRLLVGTGRGILEIKEIQPAGKKPMDVSAFLAGYHPMMFISEKND